jgi:hypothetical protein
MDNSEPLTSYQMRKRDIEFLRQRGEDLEMLVYSLTAQLLVAGVEPMLPVDSIIVGDRYLNDVNTGEFMMNVIAKTYPVKDKAHE